MRALNTRYSLVSLFIIIGGVAMAGYGFILHRSPRILIEWQTATEIDTIGFNLYRADQIEGPYQKLNASLILAANDPLRGGSYHYVDAIGMPNRIYYYQLEDVDTQGKTTRHEPVSVQVHPQGVWELIGGAGLIALGLISAIRNRFRSSASGQERSGSHAVG